MSKVRMKKTFKRGMVRIIRSLNDHEKITVTEYDKTINIDTHYDSIPNFKLVWYGSRGRFVISLYDVRIKGPRDEMDENYCDSWNCMTLWTRPDAVKFVSLVLVLFDLRSKRRDPRD